MIFPGRLRRRLTVAFVLLVGLSTATLALATYVLVREQRVHANVDRVLDNTRLNLAVVPRTRDPNRVAALLDYYGRRPGVDAVVIEGGDVFSSRSSITMRNVPASLREAVQQGGVHYRRTSIDGIPYIVAGGRASADVGYGFYFFFSTRELYASLELLRNVLVAGCVVLTVVAALVGRAIAQRTLAPVRAASQAAGALAEGLLDTRLPTGRDDEFGAWARYFNEMAAALEEKISALSQAREHERRFTSNVAHELRTPLSTLVGASSLLAEHLPELRPGARRPAVLLVDGVTRLRRLVEDLMEISRLDANSQSMDVFPIALDDVVRDTIRSHGWDSEVAVESERVVLAADARALQRIVVNLLANAVEHGGTGVRIQVRRLDNGGEIEVVDRGPGIPDDALQFVFDRFYKVDPARSNGGSGLGLAIAKENAALLGATMSASNRPGGGMRFVVQFSASTAGVVDNAAAPAAVTERSDGFSMSGRTV